jgi:YbbR domain-containing protein
VLSVAAAILLLVFNRMNNLQERAVEIPLEVILPDGYAIAAPFQEEISISIKGENEQSLQAIRSEDFRVYADLSETAAEGEFDVPVRYTRKGAALAADAYVDRVEPISVKIVLEREVTKELAVEPTLRGSPAGGYTLSEYTILPSTVKISGPQSRIDVIDKVITKEIDLSGRTGDFAVKTALDFDEPRVTVEGSQSIEFRASVKEIVVTRLFADVPIVDSNLNDTLEWDREEATGSMTLMGPQLLMDDLREEDILLSVSFAGIERPGNYRLQVRPAAPPRLTIRNYQPEEITVSVIPRLLREER